MLVHRRFLYLVLALGLAFSLYYFSRWPNLDLQSGRTLQGRVLGLGGWATSLVASASYAWQRRRAYPKEEQDTWHARLGGLALGLIVFHANLRFGNVIAVLAFLALLGGVASGVGVGICDRKLVQLAAQSEAFASAQAATLRYNRLRRRWLAVHIAAIGGLLTFAFVHILSVLYY
jgi:hypothetical protein